MIEIELETYTQLTIERQNKTAVQVSYHDHDDTIRYMTTHPGYSWMTVLVLE